MGNKCNICKGVGNMPCPRCSSGRFKKDKCKGCNGTGQRNEEWTESCSNCENGVIYVTGYEAGTSSKAIYPCESCDRKGYSSKSGIRSCSECCGTGKSCLVCEQKGFLECTICNGTGKSNKK